MSRKTSDIIQNRGRVIDFFQQFRILRFGSYTNVYFSVEELSTILQEDDLFEHKYLADVVAGSFIPLLEQITPYKGNPYVSKFSHWNSQLERTIIANIGYESRIGLIKTVAKRLLDTPDNKTMTFAPAKGSTEVIVLQLLEMLELAHCQVTSGESPEFFLRVNNVNAIEKIITNQARRISAMEQPTVEEMKTLLYEDLFDEEERENLPL